MRRSLIAAVAAAAVILSITASTALAARPVFVFTTQLTGEAERPGPGDLDARGHATIAIFPATDTICWVLTWNHVDGTVFASHIHGPTDTTAAAPVIVPLFVNEELGGTGVNRGCVVSGEWADAIVASPAMFYVNVHSLPDFGPGAIRGQLG
jgi:CHRD domain-containing protein